ncbi:MAG: efflux RND transporter periplasmic adaptor subunit, partial [Pseudomonadales bacterium]
THSPDSSVVTIRPLTRWQWRGLRIALLLSAGLLTACDRNSGGEPAPQDQTSTASTRVQVSIATVELADIGRQTSVTGVVEAFRKATVAAEVSGRVVSRLVEPGDKVSKQQKMLVLDDTMTKTAYAEALARVASRKVDLASARSELARGEKLSASAFISKDDLDSLRFSVQRAKAELKAGRAAADSAARALADATIMAPFDGSAEAVHVQEGDYLTPGMPVVTVADFSRLRIRAGVTASEAAALAAESTATLAFDVLGTTTLQGKVHSVGRIADPATGTYPLEIWLDNPLESPLREGMVASVSLSNPSGEQRPAVPVATVFRREGRMHVFTVNDDIAHLKPVRIGRRNNTLVEVLEGLKVGDSIVVDGQFALRDGAPVAIRTAGRTMKPSD